MKVSNQQEEPLYTGRPARITGETIEFRRGGQFSKGIAVSDFVGPGAKDVGMQRFDFDTYEGDIIVRVDGVPVGSMPDVLRALRDNIRGERVKVDLLRYVRGRRPQLLQAEVQLAEGS